MSLSRDLVRDLGHALRRVARLLRGLLVGVAPLDLTSLVPSAAEIDPAAVLRQE